MKLELTRIPHLLGLVSGRAWLNASHNWCEAFMRVPKPTTMPVSLDIVLTKACNLKCVFCISYSSLKGVQWMPFDFYQEVARQLFPTAHTVNFCSGGEPFLYPKFREALKLAQENRTQTIVVSNGMLINRKTAEWLVESQSLHNLRISFDGSTKQTLERIRVGASYESILANMEYLDRLKRENGAVYPRLGIRYVIMKSNADEMPAVLDVCARYNVEKLDVVYLNTANDVEFSESLYRHPEHAARVFAEAKRRGKELGVRVNLPALPGQDGGGGRCYKPWQFCQIDTDGAIRFCYKAWCQRLGFFQEGFESVWRGEHYQRIRRTVESASPYFPYCRYCSVHRGGNWEGSHNCNLHADAYVIPGLDSLQTPFNQRREENIRSFKQSRTGI
ncbi:MAG: radical SAM protein [Verrucomicrobiia bacterium]